MGDSSAVDFQVIDESELTLLRADVDFVDIREIVVDREALWVLDGAPPFLTRITHDGNEVGRFGERGEGPRDLSWPVSAQPDGRGGIRVWDRANLRVLTVDGTGVLTDSEPLEPSWTPRTRTNIGAITYADPLRIRSLGEQVVAGFYPQGANRTPDIVRGSLQRAGASLAPVGLVAEFANATDLSADNMREFASVPLWDACDRHIVYWNPKEIRVSWIDQHGEITASVELGVAPTELSLSDVEGYLEAMARLELGPGQAHREIDFTAMAHSTRDQFARIAPTVVDVRCQSEAAVWLQLFDTRTDPLGRSNRWLKVDTSGGIVGFEFPDEFQPQGFTGAGIYGAYTMVDGLQRIGRWSDFSAATGN